MVCQNLGYCRIVYGPLAWEETFMEMAFIEPLYRVANARSRKKSEHWGSIANSLLRYPFSRLIQTLKISSQKKTRTGGIDTFTLERTTVDSSVNGSYDGGKFSRFFGDALAHEGKLYAAE